MRLAPKFSEISHVQDAMLSLDGNQTNPYAPFERIAEGRMSLADMIEKIRFRFGDRAAASVKIALH